VLLKVTVFGVGLLAMVLGRLWVLGGILVLATLPYVAIRNGAVALLAAVPGLAAWNAQRIARLPSGSERYERAIARRNTPLYRLGRRLGEFSLRGMKHGYIWMVLAFAILPLYLMVVVSFKDNTQFYQAPTVLTQPMHPENWRTAWEMITPTIANSVFISCSSTLLMIGIALMGAYFFARVRMPLSNVFWNAILILMMLPMIANMVPLFRLLRDLNLLNTLTALILVFAAQGQIFAIFMLRNFVSDIPQDLYEAAEIDGASHFRQMWLIVLPLSGPILGTVGVMHFMTAWNNFVMPLIVMRDHARLPVMVQLIRMAGEYIKLWGPLMAGYAMAAIPIIILFIFSMKLFVRGMTEGAVKG
jgi:ABC-type glycerol-3-phosphate transport system permease component